MLTIQMFILICILLLQPAYSHRQRVHHRMHHRQHIVDLPESATIVEGPNNSDLTETKPAETTVPMNPNDIEDCVACRFVWLQVELDVGNSGVYQNVYDRFTSNCNAAKLAPIFYPACEGMRLVLDTMITDYMDKYTVNEMCARARMCR